MNRKKLILMIIITVLGSLALILIKSSSNAGDYHKFDRSNGEKLVQTLCLYCHSDAAVAGGRVKSFDQIMPHLSEKEFHQVVKKGVSPLMPGFPELSRNQISSIYSSLIKAHGASLNTSSKTRGRTREVSGVDGGKISKGTLESELIAKLRCPCCGKNVKDCACGLIGGIRTEIHSLVSKGMGEKEIKNALVKKYGNKILPIYEIPETLSPEPYYRVAHAYEVAKKHPDLLREITCFCPCYQVGHVSLLDCYKDDHAANCKICMDETLEADHLLNKGVEKKEIIQTIHNIYRVKGKK